MLRKAPVLFAVLALFALLGPALAGREIFAFRDMLQNYAPMKALFWRGLAGLVPTWNPGAFGGSSLLADLIQQPFYLPNLLFRLVRAPEHSGLAVYLLLHALLGLWGAYALLRRFVAEKAAGLGAAAFALCGFSLANLSNVQWACAAAWVPVLLALGEAWAAGGERGRGSRAALLALALPQPLLAGDPQLCALSWLAVAALAARHKPWRRLLAEGAPNALAALVLASPQLAATLRALPGLARSAGLPREVREQWSLHPLRIFELFVPRLFGPLFEGGFWGAATVSPPWKRNYVHSIYAGVLGPALVFAALRRREARPFLLLAALVLALALGGHFFHLYALLGEALPGFRAFRYPQRLLALFVPPLAALFALGAEGLVALPARNRLALVLGAGLLAAAGLFLCTRLLPADPGAVRVTAVQLAIASAAYAGALFLPLRLRLPALALVLVCDLCAANRELLGLLPREPFRSPPAACAALDRASGGAARSSFRVFVDQDRLFTPSARWDARVREYQAGKRNLLEGCGFREAVGLTSLEPAAEMRLWREAGPLRMLRALGTRFVISAPGSAKVYGGREAFADERWGFAVIELPATPLLLRPARVEPLASAQVPAAARGRSEIFGPGLSLLDEAPRAHLEDPSARIVSLTDRGAKITFRIAQAQPGYWVLSATLDADFRARVDGATAPLVSADLVRRAVWLPAGEHEVVLEHRPLLPLSLFALSLALTAALLAGAARRRQ